MSRAKKRETLEDRLKKEIERDEILQDICEYLQLENVDYRLQLKADIMRRVIFLTYQWKEGLRNVWISKLANRTCISTRKIRENYIQPLIHEGILQENSNRIRFAGLPIHAKSSKDNKQ